MKFGTLVLVGLLLVTSCGQGTKTPQSSPAAQATDPEIDRHKSGEHDPALIGTWKGVRTIMYRLVFDGDGSLEFQLHEQAINKGYWRTEDGELSFFMLWQDDPGSYLQSCTYAIDKKRGILSFAPDQFGGMNSGGYRQIKTAGGP